MTQEANDIAPHGNPLFYDLIASELNALLFNLGHIDDLYGVCFTAEENEETYPQIYVNDGTKVNLRVLPDSSKSMSFFVVGGNMTELDELDMAVPMGYIVWMNLQKVDPSKAYDYTEEVLRDVLNVIRKYGGYDFNVDVNSPLSEWSMMEGKAATMRPYSSFRVDFTKNVRICES